MCPTLAVTITALPNSGTPPLTVFLSSFPAGGLPPYTFLWDFGDGSPNATTQNAVHTYVQGDFAATCTVTDTLGRSVTSPPAPLTVSPVVPPASFTIQQDQVCVASGPAPLQQLPAGPSLESIPAGPALEAIPATYYDRCLGEFIGANGVPVSVFVSTISNLDGSLTIAPTSGNTIASLNTGNPNTWTALQTFGTNISLLGYPFAGGSPAVGQVIQFNGANWIAATLSASGTTWDSITDTAGAFVDTSTPGIGGIGFVGGGAFNPAAGQGLFTIGTANGGLTGNYLSIQNLAGTEIAHIDHSGNYVVGNTTSYRDGSIVVGTGTLTLPPNVTDTVVLLAANQTLTTKTLTAPTINGAAMSGTVTGSPTFSGNPTFSGTVTLSGTISGGTLSGPTLSGTVSGTPTWGSAQTFPSLNSTAHGAGSATAIGLLLGSGTSTAQAGVFTGSNHLLLIGLGYYLPGSVLGIGIGNGSGFEVGTANSIFDDTSGNLTAGGTITAFGRTITVGNGSATVSLILNAPVGTTSTIGWNGGSAGELVWTDESAAATAMILGTGGALGTSPGYTLNCAVFSVTSDSRLKPDFSPYSGDALGELDAVRVGQYSRMGPPGRVVDLGSARIGLAAETLPPGAGEVDSEGWHHMRLGETIAWEIGVMQAMRGEIRSLQNEVAALRGCQND